MQLVLGEWFDIWKKCQKEGKWALLGYLNLHMYWCFGTCWTSLHYAGWGGGGVGGSSSVHFWEIPNTFWISLLSCWASLPCQSEEPFWNAVIWLDRNRTADRVQRLHCVSGAQTDCGIASLCESSPPPRAPMFTLSDGPFWQPSHKQSSHSGEKICHII